MRGPTPARGLYLVTPDDDDDGHLLARVGAVLCFAACLQLRSKTLPADRRLLVARRLRLECTAAGVPLIVNDDPALARAVGADGVHLGEHDGTIAHARSLLGERAIIGVSCYDDLRRARDAVAAGADYVAFGAFFPSPTKPGARHADIRLLRDSAGLGVPRVAIGGISPDNARPLVDAGADLVAVVSGVFDAPDPIAAARAYLSCFEDPAA